MNNERSCYTCRYGDDELLDNPKVQLCKIEHGIQHWSPSRKCWMPKHDLSLIEVDEPARFPDHHEDNPDVAHAKTAADQPVVSTHPERDPSGLGQHEPGAKLDAGKPRPGLVFGGFANALEQVVMVGTRGAKKYTDNGWKEVPNGVERYTDAMLRHWLKEQKGELHDPEWNLLHAAHLAWNALARLEKIIETNNELP